MKLLIKQRVFSWTDTYDIYDESEEAKYYVESEFFTIGHVIHVYDRGGQEVGCIRQKIFTFMPKFELEIGGRTVGMIKKEFTFLKPRYVLDCNNWVVEGDFWEWDYDVLDNGVPVMHISKEWFHWGDTYVLDIPDSANEVIGLLIAIAIDAANCGND